MSIQAAIEHHQSGRFDQAEKIYIELLQKQPNDANILHLLGLIAFQADKYKEATELIEKAILIDKYNPLYYSNLGAVYRKDNQIDFAIVCYQKAIKIKPDYANAYFNLGNAFYDIKNIDGAINAYRQAAIFNLNYPETYYRLAEALKDKGKFDESNQFYKKARELGFNGRIIYHNQDTHGVLEIVQVNGIQSLHFGAYPVVQSEMSLSEPDRILHICLRAMLAPLLFINKPSKVLIVGLGGGVLAKFILKNYPDCKVEAVELREAVVKISHDYFYLPKTKRLNIKISDGFNYIYEKAKNTKDKYDFILIDAPEGMDESLQIKDFLNACSKLLNHKGALSVNMWRSDFWAHDKTYLNSAIKAMRQVFKENSLMLPNNFGNVILMGFDNKLERPKLLNRDSKYIALEEKLGVGIDDFYHDLGYIADMD